MFDRRTVIAGGLGLAVVPGFANASLADDNPIVDAFVRDSGFQGVLATAKAGRVRYSRAFGMADIAANAPATIGTRYAVASISKWLTTLTVLRLVEQGKVSLDAPILAALPEYRADTGAKVTLAHLLSNTSGIPNGFISALRADSTLLSQRFDPADAVKRFCSGDLAFEPGSKFDYAMTNWFVVMAIIERTSGQPFEQAMKALTLDPLGLKHSGADARAGDALSYRTVEPLVVWPDARNAITAASGGYISTAEDLIRAAHLVFDGKFLSRASLNAMGTVRVPEQDYALGGRVRTMTIAGKPVTAAWETGRTAGFRSLLAHRYDTRETVVILNNTALEQKALDLFADKLFGAELRTA